MSFMGKLRLKVLTSFNPVCPKCGPYEASEGFTPVMGKEKTDGKSPASKPLVSKKHTHLCPWAPNRTGMQAWPPP